MSSKQHHHNSPPPSRRRFRAHHAVFVILVIAVILFFFNWTYRFTGVNLSDSRALPERLWCVQMTASGWAMVRQKPLVGRSFVPDDERTDSTPTVMLTHKVWERRYGGDPAILGKAIRIDNVDRVVVGVMPPGAQFPEDTDL